MRFVDTTAPVVQCTSQQIVLNNVCTGEKIKIKVLIKQGQIPTISHSEIDCDTQLTTVQFPNNQTIINGITTINITLNISDTAGNIGLP